MSIFEQIDKELGKKEPKELYSIYLVIVLVIGFLFYQFVFPIANEKYQNAVNTNKSLKSSISKKENEIRVIQMQLARGAQKVKKLNQTINVLDNRAKDLKEEVKKLSFVIFNSKEWADLLKDSVMNAIKEGMEVKLVSSSLQNVKDYLKCFANEKSSDEKLESLTLSNISNGKNIDLKPILNSYITCRERKNNLHFINKKLTFTLIIRSKYKNLLSYIYDYENRKELFRIESLSINRSGNYILKISLYGYEK